MATLMVLGGGGALGAYQAGCLVALAETGALPDALFGCSAGALNAAFLAQDPSLVRAEALADWWRTDTSRSLLAPSLRARVRSVAASARSGATSLLDASALRRVVTTHVSCHDLSELAVPLTVTTTCLDCAAAMHHASGPVADTLVASCALPGLLPPVRLPDGHRSPTSSPRPPAGCGQRSAIWPRATPGPGTTWCRSSRGLGPDVNAPRGAGGSLSRHPRCRAPDIGCWSTALRSCGCSTSWAPTASRSMTVRRCAASAAGHLPAGSRHWSSVTNGSTSGCGSGCRRGCRLTAGRTGRTWRSRRALTTWSVRPPGQSGSSPGSG